MNAFLPKLKSGFDDEEGETVKDGEGVIELYELDKNGKLLRLKLFETKLKLLWKHLKVWLLFNASEFSRYDRKSIMKAIRKIGYLLLSAPESHQKDRELVNKAVEKRNGFVVIISVLSMFEMMQKLSRKQ